MVCFSTNRFLLCLGKSCLYPSAKIQNFIEIQSNIIELHPKSPVFSGQHQRERPLMKDAASNQDPQSVIFEVSITVSHSLYQFHFPMEALGYSVIFRKSPLLCARKTGQTCKG